MDKRMYFVDKIGRVYELRAGKFGNYCITAKGGYRSEEQMLANGFEIKELTIEEMHAEVAKCEATLKKQIDERKAAREQRIAEHCKRHAGAPYKRYETVDEAVKALKAATGSGKVEYFINGKAVQASEWRQAEGDLNIYRLGLAVIAEKTIK